MPDLQELSPEVNLALKTAAGHLRREFEGIFSVETIERFLWPALPATDLIVPHEPADVA